MQDQITAASGFHDARTPVRLFGELVALGCHPVWFWQAPGREAMLGWGASARVTIGPGRGWRRRLAALPEVLLARRRDDARVRTTAFIRCAFDPGRLPAEEWRGLGGISAHIPGGLLRWSPGGSELDIPAHVPGSREARDAWEEALRRAARRPSGRAAEITDVDWHDDAFAAAVRQGLTALEAGVVAKVVLARSVDVRFRTALDAPRLMNAVLRRNPTSFVLAIAEGDAVFLSATPERLARVEQGRALSEALAGSRPASADAVQAELATGKNTREHASVVRGVRRGLAACSDGPVHIGEAHALELPTVTHLRTPLEAALRPGLGLPDVAARLHPTPAVCGHPREHARRLIRRVEGFDRGLYSGFIGWFNGTGDGEAAVALRTALIRGATARLHAGAGIMVDSRVEEELRETRAKAHAIFDAL